MRTIKTTTGADIALDGDLLAVMETLDPEVTVRRGLERSFEDMSREITHLIDQMSEDERRAYLLESLFLNTVKYENDKLEGYMRPDSQVGRRLSPEPRKNASSRATARPSGDGRQRPDGLRDGQALDERPGIGIGHHLRGKRRVQA